MLAISQDFPVSCHCMCLHVHNRGDAYCEPWLEVTTVQGKEVNCAAVLAALSPLHCAPVQGKRCLLLRKSIHCTRNHPVSYNIDTKTSELLTQESSEELLMLCTTLASFSAFNGPRGCLSCKTLSVLHNFLDFRF